MKQRSKWLILGALGSLVLLLALSYSLTLSVHGAPLQQVATATPTPRTDGIYIFDGVAFYDNAQDSCDQAVALDLPRATAGGLTCEILPTTGAQQCIGDAVVCNMSAAPITCTTTGTIHSEGWTAQGNDIGGYFWFKPWMYEDTGQSAEEHLTGSVVPYGGSGACESLDLDWTRTYTVMPVRETGGTPWPNIYNAAEFTAMGKGLLTPAYPDCSGDSTITWSLTCSAGGTPTPTPTPTATLTPTPTATATPNACNCGESYQAVDWTNPDGPWQRAGGAPGGWHPATRGTFPEPVPDLPATAGVSPLVLAAAVALAAGAGAAGVWAYRRRRRN